MHLAFKSLIELFDSIHFVPIKSAIEAGTDLIMSSHIATPGLTGLDTLPATLSREVVRILREDLGFNGVLITDAMAMGGITRYYEFTEAAVLAFKAGHDMILGSSPIKFADTLTALVEKGEISLKQLQTSVRKILEVKAKLGLHKERRVNLDGINAIVGNRNHQLKIDSAAFSSIVLLRDRHNCVPVDNRNTKKVLSISYDRDNTTSEIISAGNEFNKILLEHISSVNGVRLSPTSAPSIYEKLMEKSDNVDQVILSVYLRPELGMYIQDEISESLVQYINDLQSRGRYIIVVSFGELEVLNYLPNLGTFMMARSGQDVMQRAAAKTILGMNPITGHLPVNLTPYHKRVDGLERESTRQ
jgi:beta-N-acetylhexosaminidase